MDFIDKMVYGGIDLYQFLKDFLEYLRRVLLIKFGSAATGDFADHSKQALEDAAMDGISVDEEIKNLVEHGVNHLLGIHH